MLGKLKEVEFRVIDIFEKNGFEEIHVPVIYFSQDGKAVHIREDFTWEISKIVKDKKVYYRGSIVRPTSFGKPKEIYQVGCEIIREKIQKEDIICCARTLEGVINEIQNILKQDVLLMIGHYGITRNVLGEKSEIFFKKDITKISELLSSSQIDVSIARTFFKVLKSLDEMKGVINIPEDLIIFSEVKAEKVYNLPEKVEKDYYDGIVFHGFINGEKFLTGGKYKMEGKEGIGFSLNLFSFDII